MIALLLGGLVTWRVSRMLSKEIGPLGVFARMRASAAENQRQIGGLYDALSCVACVSVYVGLLTAVWFSWNLITLIMYTLAFSAIATIIEATYVKFQK